MSTSYLLGAALRRVVRPGVRVSESCLTKHRAHFSSRPSDTRSLVSNKLEAQGLPTKQAGAKISTISETFAESQISQMKQLGLLQSEIQKFQCDLKRMCSDSRHRNAEINSQIKDLRTEIHYLINEVEHAKYKFFPKSTGSFLVAYVIGMELYSVFRQQILDFLKL